MVFKLTGDTQRHSKEYIGWESFEEIRFRMINFHTSKIDLPENVLAVKVSCWFSLPLYKTKTEFSFSNLNGTLPRSVRTKTNQGAIETLCLGKTCLIKTTCLVAISNIPLWTHRIALLFFFFFFFCQAPCGWWDLSSSTRYRTQATAVEPQNPNY